MGIRRLIPSPLVAVAIAVFSLSWTPVCAQSSPTPRPSSTATKTPEPTPTPQKLSKCCWCVLPNEGEYSEQESRKLMDYCDLCLTDPAQNPKAVGCNGAYNTSPSRFESDLVWAKSRGECSNEVYVANMQHGPIFDVVSGLISICVKQFPSCSIEVDDRSCRTFSNETEAKVFLTTLQGELDDEGSLTICGNSSNDFSLTCARLAASKRYVVSKHSLSEEKMRCNREGRSCNPVGYTWKCLDFGKKLITQKCCGGKTAQTSSFGHWVNNAECSGAAECPDRCAHSNGKPAFIQKCVSPTKKRWEWCEELSGGGFACIDWESQCGPYYICIDGECAEEHLSALPTPTATATISPRSQAKAAKSSSGALNILNPLKPLTPAKGVPHHFVASSSTLSVAFTPQPFFGGSAISQFQGIRGETGVALITVDPISTIGMLGLTSGDVIHYVNNHPIRIEADIFEALAQSRTRTFITFSRAAPKEQAKSNSILPKPTRWNWIVTIHAQDKIPSMDR